MARRKPERDESDHTLRGYVVWVDAQLPPSLARWLASEYSVNARHVQEVGLLHEADLAIFDSASAIPETVVLVTKDADFVPLLQERGPPPAVVWVRTGNLPNRELRRIVLAAWPRAAALIRGGEALVEIRRDRGGAT